MPRTSNALQPDTTLNEHTFTFIFRILVAKHYVKIELSSVTPMYGRIYFLQQNFWSTRGESWQVGFKYVNRIRHCLFSAAVTEVFFWVILPRNICRYHGVSVKDGCEMWRTFQSDCSNAFASTRRNKLKDRLTIGLPVLNPNTESWTSLAKVVPAPRFSRSLEMRSSRRSDLAVVTCSQLAFWREQNSVTINVERLTGTVPTYSYIWFKLYLKGANSVQLSTTSSNFMYIILHTAHC